MRIISGNFKGRKILTPNDIKTRPLKDLTKDLINADSAEELKTAVVDAADAADAAHG